MEERTIKSKFKIDSIGEECTIHLFDFGGHDYYHDTHHLFYGINAIYILLWNKETDELAFRESIQQDEDGEKFRVKIQDYPIKYWLDSVKHHIKDVQADNFEFRIERALTYTSSVLLIQNKVSRADENKPLNNLYLSEKYSFIYDFITLSILHPKRNLHQFDVLFTEMLNNLGIIGAVLPKFYGAIKDEINIYKGEPVISITQFLDFCNDKLKTKLALEQVVLLASYLAEIGVIIYSDKTPNGKIYINKNWVVGNIYKILRGLPDKGGEFDESHVVNSIVKNNSYKELPIESQARSLIEIMIQFKIIFKHPYNSLYIAPLYLPLMPINAINLFISLREIPYRRFEYSGFIHKQVVLCFFHDYGQLILNDKSGLLSGSYYYWKDGLIIKNPSTEEIVKIKFDLGSSEGNAFIDIFDITRSGETMFIRSIVNYIIDINKGYDIEEMVTLDGKNFVSVEILQENAEKGKWIFSEQRLADKKKVKDEDKFFKLKDYQMFITNRIRKKKVVISYSKKDVASIHTLIRYLRPLVDSDLIEEPWYCSANLPASEWDDVIKEKLIDADIVFFMISEYFYSTPYIIENEIKPTITRYNSDKSVMIVPIVLEFYDWSRPGEWDLKRFSALPYQAKPISDFHNPKIAWSTITTSIKAMIEKDLDPGKKETVNRDLQEIYDRQVNGKLDKNS